MDNSFFLLGLVVVISISILVLIYYNYTKECFQDTTNEKEALNNNNIRTAVNDYLSGDEGKKLAVIEKYGDISNWDTSGVTYMSELFKGKKSFNGDISKWNVDSVKYMNSMFNEATSFNRDINTKYVFDNNGNKLYLAWDTKNVINMAAMFKGASLFNVSLNKWDTSNVEDMSEMFMNTVSLDNYIDAKNTVIKRIKGGYIRAWNTKNVKNMSNMFNGASSFVWILSKWDLSNCIDMSGMFSGATSFNGWFLVDLGSSYHLWDVSNVKNMRNMFSGATSFNGDISKWTPISANIISNMFKEATSLDLDISIWNKHLINVDVDGMKDVFLNATRMNEIYPSTVGNKTKWVDETDGYFTEVNPKPKYLNNTEIKKAVNLWFSDYDKCITKYGHISDWNTSYVTNMSGLFSSNETFNEDISNWDTSNVRFMNDMFSGAKSFNGDISKWNTSKVISMDTMFYRASSFNRDIRTKDILDTNGIKLYTAWDTSSVQYMDYMFWDATSFYGDISKWNTSKVNSMYGVFNGATKMNECYPSTIGNKTKWVDKTDGYFIEVNPAIPTSCKPTIPSTITTITPTTTTTPYAIIEYTPIESNELSIVEGKTKVIVLLDKMEIKHLKSTNFIIRRIIRLSNTSISNTSISIQQKLLLIKEIINKFVIGGSQREMNKLSQTPEYSSLRDYLSYTLVDYSNDELNLILELFTVMYNIVPIENKGSLINSYLFEVNKRLMAKQKEEEMKRREEMYEQQQEETSPQEPARDPLVAEERLNAFLQDKTPDKFEELFGKVEPQDMVYNVGVPVGDFMKQIIRPQDWSRALRPPSCIRDSTQLVEPVAILDQGIPSNVHEFRGGSKTLPKFAYTEVYDPKFY
jgi:surface protein